MIKELVTVPKAIAHIYVRTTKDDTCASELITTTTIYVYVIVRGVETIAAFRTLNFLLLHVRITLHAGLWV